MERACGHLLYLLPCHRRLLGRKRRGLILGRGGESWGWGEWHMPLLGFVPTLFCLFKNLFRIILGPHCSSGRNNCETYSAFHMPPLGESHIKIVGYLHMHPCSCGDSCQEIRCSSSASVSLAPTRRTHVTSRAGKAMAGLWQVGSPLGARHLGRA